MMRGFMGFGGLMLGTVVTVPLYTLVFAFAAWRWARSKRAQATRISLAALGLVATTALVTAVVAFVLFRVLVNAAFGAEAASATVLGMLAFAGISVAPASLVAALVVRAQKEKLAEELDDPARQHDDRATFQEGLPGGSTIVLYEVAVWLVPLVYAASRL